MRRLRPHLPPAHRVDALADLDEDLARLVRLALVGREQIADVRTDGLDDARCRSAARGRRRPAAATPGRSGGTPCRRCRPRPPRCRGRPCRRRSSAPGTRGGSGRRGPATRACRDWRRVSGLTRRSTRRVYSVPNVRTSQTSSTASSPATTAPSLTTRSSTRAARRNPAWKPRSAAARSRSGHSSSRWRASGVSATGRRSQPGSGRPSMLMVASTAAPGGIADTSKSTTDRLSRSSPVTRATLSLEPSPRLVSSSVGRRPGTNGTIRHSTAASMARRPQLARRRPAAAP